MQKTNLIKFKLLEEQLRIPSKEERQIEVGNNIRKWRTLKGIKQEMLAEELEISRVSISKIETGKTDIPLNRLYKIARALGIKVELLFSDPATILQENDLLAN